MSPLNDAYLAVFCEGKDNALVTVTWILYGLSSEQVEAVRRKRAGLFDSLFPTIRPASAPA